MELLLGLGLQAIMVVAVDHVNNCLGVLEVVPPHLSKTLLTTHVPHREGNVLVGNLFHIESDSWNGSELLTQFKLIEDCGLSGGIEAHHQDAHFLVEGKQSAPYFRHYRSHVFYCCLNINFDKKNLNFP